MGWKPAAKPIYGRVEGSPYQPGDRVVVVDGIDQNIHDTSRWLGRIGTVWYLEYSCGCGQVYPDTPMIGVRFFCEGLEEFWPEELDQPIKLSYGFSR